MGCYDLGYKDRKEDGILIAKVKGVETVGSGKPWRVLEQKSGFLNCEWLENEWSGFCGEGGSIPDCVTVSTIDQMVAPSLGGGPGPPSPFLVCA